MQQDPSRNLPERHIQYPRLRPLDVKWVGEGDERYLHLRDPLGLCPGEVLVPSPLAPFLALCDGEHNLPTIRAALALYRGVDLTPEQTEKITRELDEALALEGPRFEEAHRDALAAYRTSPFRTPALAGAAYPGDPTGLEKALDGYCAKYPAKDAADALAGPVVGILSPHIDYQRGHRVYAESWPSILPALAQCEQVIVFGTDHSGGAGRLTLTRQPYATPWGVLPSDKDLTSRLVQALGEEAALQEELHHAREHSIELATVWLHYMLRRARGKATFHNLPTVLPVLCGSLTDFIQGDQDPGWDPTFARALEVLRRAMEGKRTLIVAAGDLAHVGPAFGDAEAWDVAGRAQLRDADQASLEAACRGDAQGFFQGLQAEKDRRRVCGQTPIYLALRLMGSNVSGEALSYDQCPADAQSGSLVSIAGVVWREKQ
ncbi:MAG: AmmeMemoRadiSam system protein B [Chloroflexi bacterium]|nr:AmmeMemoRadiSam system protein B [Chloroflexota bacterium]